MGYESNDSCLKMVFDKDNATSNIEIWNTYGSELANDFGMKPCGKPVVWGNRCEEHKEERRNGFDRRKESIYQQIRQYVIDRSGIPLAEDVDPVEWILASHYSLGEMVKELKND